MSRNLISKMTSKMPSYNPSISYPVIEVSFRYDGTVALKRYIDGNYITWFALANIEEELSPYIKEILHDEIVHFSDDYIQFNSHGYSDYVYWYTFRIRCDVQGWLTPFGHGYSMKQPENIPGFIAKDLKEYYWKLKQAALLRDNTIDYKAMVDSYTEQYSTQLDPMLYPSMAALHLVVDNDKYLLLSDNENLRDSYIKCLKAQRVLYNRYMTLAR